MQKKVYICAPLEGIVQDLLTQAIEYTKFALKSGVAPITPQFYHLCLDSRDSDKKTIIRSAGTSVLWFCDEIWVFGEIVTESMKAEIAFCKNMRIKIRRVKNSEIKKVIGEKR